MSAGGAGGAEGGCGGETHDVCEGECVSITSHVEHCGECGLACPDDDPNGTPVCVGYIAPGYCGSECDPGYDLVPPNELCQPIER